MQINQDIAVFQGLVPAGVCTRLIDYYTRMLALGMVFGRGVGGHLKQDSTVVPLTYASMSASVELDCVADFMPYFYSAWEQYISHYSLLAEAGPYQVRSCRLQRTLPGEGYHQWHYEADTRDRSARIAAWGLYLNTVESGGETEFLYQHRRVQAEQGTLVVWPAAYTHPHRGNPPLSGEKYLLTGWVEY